MRRFSVQALEKRQMLAGDFSCELMVPPPAQQAAVAAAGVEAVVQPTSFESATAWSSLAAVQQDVLPIGRYFYASQDLIHETASHLFVVNNTAWADAGTLHVFERGQEGELSVVGEVQLDFEVQQMETVGDRVVLAGSDNAWRRRGLELQGEFSWPEPPSHLASWSLLSVEVVDGVIETQSLSSEGILDKLLVDGDQVVAISHVESEYLIAIYPPPPRVHLISTYEFTGDGIVSKDGTASFETARHVSTPWQAELRDGSLHLARALPIRSLVIEPLVTDGESADASESRLVRDPVGAPEVREQEFSIALLSYDVNEVGVAFASETPIGSVTRPGSDYGVWFGNLEFDIDPDGDTALVRRQDQDQRDVLDLIDLSGDQPAYFETLTLGQPYHHLLFLGNDHALFTNGSGRNLLWVDTNLSIDIASELRLREIELPEDLELSFQSVAVSDTELVVLAHELPRPVPPIWDDGVGGFGTDGSDGDALGRRPQDLSFAPPPQQKLLVISLATGELLSSQDLPDSLSTSFLSGFESIDPVNRLFGFRAERVHYLYSATDAAGVENARWGEFVSPQTYVVAKLGDDHQLSMEREFDSWLWLETDVTPQRLIARQFDRILEYDLSEVSEPTITPLGELTAPLEAVDDAFTLTGDVEPAVIDVLANDVKPDQRSPYFPRIQRLIEAPRGALIQYGGRVSLSAELLASSERIEFQYEISNGLTTSIASVVVDVVTIDERELAEMQQAAITQAAADLGVAEDAIEVMSVEKVYETGDSASEANLFPDDLELPGVIVRLMTSDRVATYAVGVALTSQQLKAQQLSVEQRFLVDVRLRAVNEEGETVDTVSQDQLFWIEVEADDLRVLGSGVYAVFFNLEVPPEHLEIMGPVEAANGFTLLGEESVRPNEIVELGAIGDVVENPGGAPQTLMRFAVIAHSPGSVTLQPKAAESVGTEVLLRGVDTEIDDSRVSLQSLDLTVEPQQDVGPLDVNANGEITSSDALRVINFLGLFGSTSVEDLDRIASQEAESSSPFAGPAARLALRQMRRMDTNQSGWITALDALVVINRLDLIRSVESEAVSAIQEDDESFVEMMLPTQEDQKLF